MDAKNEVAQKEQVVLDTHPVDDAKAFLDSNEGITWSLGEERNVLRKIDMRLLPLMFFGYLLMYMDTQCFGLAAIFGMIQDLGLYKIVSIDPLLTSTTKFSWASSIPYWGSLISQFPLLVLAQYMPLGKFQAGVVAWTGFFAVMMIVVQDFSGTMVVRFFYGFQVVCTGIYIIITSMWYEQREQSLRIALWQSGAAFGALVGQAFDYGAAKIQGSLSSWRWMYVLIGALSISFAILSFFFFPDNPMKATFLDQKERQIAIRRLQRNSTGIQSRKFKRDHLIEAFKDPQVYLITLVFFVVAFANASFSSFGALLLTSLGYETFRAIQLFMPSSAMIIISVFSSSILARFTKHRIFIAMAYIIPSIVGNAMLWKSRRTERASLLAGLYICVTFYGAFVQVVSLITSNIAGHTKKTVVSALATTFSYIGAVIAPFIFKGEEQAEGYPTGVKTLLSLFAVAELALIVLWFYYQRMNSRKAKQMDQIPSDWTEERVAYLDLTDKQNPHFRYSF